MSYSDRKHVMLSYNHESKGAVKLVRDLLRKQNIEVWFDRRDDNDYTAE